MDQLNLFPEKVEGASDEASNAFLSEIETNNQKEEDQIEATAQASEPEEQVEEPAANVGTERNFDVGELIGNGVAAVVDAFDGSRNYEEVREDMREGEEQRRKDRASNPISGTLDEIEGIAKGSAIGVAETALGAGEVLGDSIKSLGEQLVRFATRDTVQPDFTRGGRDNPFSEHYDWATWNLGKDEYGAQTKVGKGIQEITEFGLTMALTGGFGGGGTTIAGNIVRGGVRGMAADALSAVGGDGNMSNAIEETFPELKDTWLTALAIDKEDNVFSAATKTALEGFGLGSAIEAGVRYGWRGAKGLFKPSSTSDAVLEANALLAGKRQIYHGTSQESARLIRENGFRGSRRSVMPGGGVYFAEDARYAGSYAFDDGLSFANRDGSVIDGAPEPTGEVLKALLPEGSKILDIPATGLSLRQFAKKKKLGSSVIKWAKENGYTGIRYSPDFNEVPGKDAQTAFEYFIFDPKVADEAIKPVPSPQEFIADRLLSTGDTKRWERYSQILDLEAGGIPTTWDDAAAVVPEYFLPAAPGMRREIMADFAVRTNDRLVEMIDEFKARVAKGEDPKSIDDIGDSLDPFTGENPVSGYMVAIDGEVLDNPLDPDEVAAFIQKNQDMLRREDVYLGAWVEEGKLLVELSRNVEDFEESMLLGRLFDQYSIFDLKTFDTVSTGGSDALRQTKGAHLRSAYTTPQEPTITPAPKVAAQQIEGRLSVAPPANGGGGGRLATNAQVKQIADARGEGAGEAIESLIKSVDVDESTLAKEARLTVSSLRDIVEGDLANFLDVDGKLIEDAFSTINYGDETILSRRGAFQVRAMMANTASAIYDAAYKVSKTSAEGIPADMHVATLKDNLMALLRMHKHTSNLIGTRLADYSINVGDMNLTMKGFMNAADPQKLDETIEQAGKQLEDMVKGIESGDPKALQQAQRTASMLQLTGGDVTKMVDVAQNMGTLGTDAALKLMYNSMLSAPATHVVNNMSNAFNVVYRPLTAMVGGNAKAKKAAIASYYNFFKTIPEAFELAMRTGKTGVSNVGGSRDLIQQGQTTAALKELSQRAAESNNIALKAGSGLVHMLHDVANFPLFSWPERFLTTSDEFFKVMVTRMEFNRFQMEKAIDLAGSEGESAVEETFKRLLKSEYSRNFTKSGGLLNDELLKGAKEVTFQTDLEGAAGKFASFLNDVPALRVFFPFVKTGHNVLVYTGTHIPVLNLALKESREVLLQDTFEGAVMRGRLAFGTMTVLGAATLATQGLITGNGPAGGARRKEWLKTHQPRSLRVGDRWVSYDRIEPFGQILAAVADVHYAFTTGDLEEDKAKYLAGYLSHALAVNLTDKSMLQGLEPMSALLNARQFSPDTFMAFGVNTANSFIPLSGARRALTNSLHPYMQEFNNQYERALYSASLGVMGERAPTIDYLTGEKITAGNGGFGNANLPFKVVKRGEDPVKDALEDIEFDTSVVSDELGGVELTPEQRSNYQLYISETGIYDKLKAWVTQPSFKEAHQEYVQRLKDGHRVKKEDQYFYRQITKMLREAKKIAVLRLRNEYPDLNAEIMLDKYAAQQDRLPNGYQSLINFGNE